MTRIKMAELLTQFTLKDFAVKTHKKKTTYLLPLGVLMVINAKPWNRQRPVDEARITEIAASIENEDDVSGIISMAWHPTQDLVIYDGQHRWSALKLIYEVNKESTIRAFVEIMWTATEDEIEKAFKTINQAVSVSELYMDNSADVEKVKVKIQEFVARMSQTFPTFVSANKKPNRPNFNRDLVIDEIFRLWADIFERNVDISKIIKAIMQTNTEYQRNELSSPRTAVKKNIKTYEKCAKANFWLFAETGKLNIDHIKATLSVSA